MILKRIENPRLYTQQIKLLFKNAYLGIPATIVNLCVLGVVLWNVISRRSILMWLAGNIALQIGVFLLVRRYFSGERSDSEANRWGFYFNIGLLLAGLAFGSAGYILFAEDLIEYQVFLAFVLGGMLAGAVGILSATLSSFLSFSIPVFLPIMVHFFVHRHGLQVTMGILCLVYWAVMVGASKLVRDTVKASIELRFERASMLETLESEIEQRKILEQELKENKERLDLAIHGSGLGLWDWNIESGEVVINDRWAEMLGYTAAEIEPNVDAWKKMIHPDDISMVMDVLDTHLADKTHFYEAEYRLRTKAGNWKWILDSGLVVERDQNGKAIRATGFHRDINEKKELEDKLRRMSMVDGLTGLANRRHFDEIFDREWRRCVREKREISVIMIDIDYFKRYNDRYGHQAGDDCLRSVGNTLAATIKRPGDFAARYGGEEFVVVLPMTDLENALNIAEMMRAHVSDLNIRHDDSHAASVVTISAGVAAGLPDKDMSPAHLIKKADDALYEAKNTGRNRVMAS